MKTYENQPFPQELSNPNRDLLRDFPVIRSALQPEQITGCQGPVMSVAFNLDASLVATGSYDRLCKLWRVEDGVCLQSLVGHSHLDASGWKGWGNGSWRYWESWRLKTIKFVGFRW